MEEIALNWVDYSVGIVVLLCVVMGAFSGFVMQLASFFSLIAGLLLAIFFSRPLAEVISERWLDSYNISKFIANISCFLGGSALVRIVAQMLSGVIKKLRLENFDRILGAVAGFLKGVFICLILLIIMSKSGMERFERPVKESVSGDVIMAATDRVVAWFKEERTSDGEENTSNDNNADVDQDEGEGILEKSKKLLESVKEDALSKLEIEKDKTDSENSDTGVDENDSQNE